MLMLDQVCVVDLTGRVVVVFGFIQFVGVF